MNKKNIILLIIICLILGLLYFYMQHQIKSTEHLLENASLSTSSSIQKPSSVSSQRKILPQSEPTQISPQHIEIDDGLDIPPDDAETVMAD